MKLNIPCGSLKKFAIGLPDGAKSMTLEDVIKAYCAPQTVIGYGYNDITQTYEVLIDDADYQVML